jgi:hypothetical protein
MTLRSNGREQTRLGYRSLLGVEEADAAVAAGLVAFGCSPNSFFKFSITGASARCLFPSNSCRLGDGVTCDLSKDKGPALRRANGRCSATHPGGVQFLE